jgi:ribosomal protein S18 acetylase RimI-like enzyme
LYLDGRHARRVSVAQGSRVNIMARAAQRDDLDDIAHLFDAYRQFYGQTPDASAARAFIRDRFERGESTILVAGDGPSILGFAQLYPTFCSVAAAPIWVLYDLFVDPRARRRGVGRALLRAAPEHARAHGAVRLELATARGNAAAQALYESEGWARDDEFLRYGLALR